MVEMRFTFHLVRGLRWWESGVDVFERMCCQGEKLAGGVRAIKENWAANGQAIISRASSTPYYTSERECLGCFYS